MLHSAESHGMAYRRAVDDHTPMTHSTNLMDQGSLDLWGSDQPPAHEQAASWFRMDRHPCFLLAANARILAANPQAEQMLHAQKAISLSGGILSFRCERSQQALRLAVAAVCRSGGGRQRNIVRGDDSEWRKIDVIGSPDHNSAFATFTVSADNIDTTDEMNILADAFGLTRTESCVMAGLVSGRAPKEIAGHLSISTHTVRSHLRAIYAKMDVKGISGTIRLAMRLFH